MVSSTYMITDPLGRIFNLATAYEYWFQPEPVEEGDQVNSFTLVARWANGAKQYFPGMNMLSIISLSEGLQGHFISGVSNAPIKQYWIHSEGPKHGIQPTYRVEGIITGSEYRNLVKAHPECVNLSIQEKLDMIKEKNIQPDYCFIHGIPYIELFNIYVRLGATFFESAKEVEQKLEESFPGMVSQHLNRNEIRAVLRKPFNRMKKAVQEQKQQEVAKQKQRLAQAGLKF